VERVGEVEELYELVSEANAGEGRVALIEGAAGVGKSRLLEETRARGEREGMRVVRARGSELEKLFSFGVVRQLFEAQLGDPDTRGAALAGAAALAEAAFAAPGPEGDEPADASFTTLHALYWLALNLSEDQPLLLAVDDLHWCDRASLRFLAYLAGRLEGQPILLATTLRSTDPGVDPALLADVAHAPATRAIRPGPLTPEAVTELVRERLGPDAQPGFCEACHTGTGGNPLLLGQLLSALEADSVRPDEENAGAVRDIGPRAVTRTVLMRLGRLAEPAIEVARAVAVLGDGADLATITAFSGLDEAPVATTAGELARAEILAPDVPLGFVHPLVRDAVYEELAPTERELAHARAADVMVKAGASDEQIAAHLLVMARRGEQWVVDRLWEAARTSVSQGSPDGAVSYLRRALEEPATADQRPQLLLELGMAEALTSGAAAVEHLEAAYELLEDEPEKRAAAAPVLAQSLIFTGASQEAAAFAREAPDHLPDELAPMRDVLEAIELGTTMFGVAEPDMIRRLREYRERPVGPGPGDKMIAALTAWEWMLTGGGVAECADLARASLADDTMVAADNGFLTVPAIGVLFLADLDEAPERWDRLLAESHRCGSLFAISCVHLWNGITMTRRGELAESEELLRAGRDELALWGRLPVDGAYFTSTIALARLEQGDVEGARRELGPRPDRSFDAYDAAFLWLRTDCEVLLAEGDNEEALARADEYGQLVGRLVNPAWVPWRSLKAQALDRLGRPDEAIALAEDELGHARDWGAPGTVGRSLRVLGTLRRGDGLDQLEESVAVLEGSPARLELAKSLAALGGAVRRERRPSEAREPLRRALELAEVCGAEGLVAETRTELYAAGSRPRTGAMTGSGALTASEKRVAALAAEGMTNRDIAQALFVTPKTVEVHLSATYRKLGIRSRRALAGSLAAA
jgi:DNA-binding CsgD family transcriptional regulator